MRKYIHKFKNYTSVEVDNLHDLKEGDLALYEDKFLTRNNGKVEEVVKGSGSSSEDEYSTDYPDDILVAYSTGTDAQLVKPVDSVLTTRGVVLLDTTNIDIESIIIEGYTIYPLYKDSSFSTLEENPCIHTQYIRFNESPSIFLHIYPGYHFYKALNSESNIYESMPLTIKFRDKKEKKLYKLTFSSFKLDNSFGEPVYVNKGETQYIKPISIIPTYSI